MRWIFAKSYQTAALFQRCMAKTVAKLVALVIKCRVGTLDGKFWREQLDQFIAVALYLPVRQS